MIRFEPNAARDRFEDIRSHARQSLSRHVYDGNIKKDRVFRAITELGQKFVVN